MALGAPASDLNAVLDAVGPLWDDLRGARLFITGGTGFVGCWLLETVLWANDRRGLGATVTVLTRRPEAFARKAPHLVNHPAVRLHEGDVRTFTYPAGPFTHVIHAATAASAPVSPAETFETIVDGTRRTLACARATGAERFLLTSSGAVYGAQPAHVTHVDEDFTGAPATTVAASAYGEGKRVAELLCTLTASPTLTPVMARCFAFVGPYLPIDRHFAIGNFIRDALTGGPIRVSGDGTPLRSYLYASDLAVWLWTVLLRGESRRPYNVGSSSATSIAELARVVSDIAGCTRGVTLAQRPATGPPQRYVPSVARAETELALRPTVSLEDAIRRTLAWHSARQLAVQP